MTSEQRDYRVQADAMTNGYKPASTQAGLAFLFGGTLSLAVLVIVVAFWWASSHDKPTEPYGEFLGQVVAALSPLVYLVAGYYFGRKTTP